MDVIKELHVMDKIQHHKIIKQHMKAWKGGATEQYYIKRMHVSPFITLTINFVWYMFCGFIDCAI